jgi:hypothetical protein
MNRSSSSQFQLVQTLGGEPPSLVGDTEELEVVPSDLRELAHLGLIRDIGNNTYEVSNAGRAAVSELEDDR